MSPNQARSTYEIHASATYGGRFAGIVSRFQAGFLADGVCADQDAAFVRAVDAAVRFLPILVMRSDS